MAGHGYKGTGLDLSAVQCSVICSSCQEEHAKYLPICPSLCIILMNADLQRNSAKVVRDENIVWKGKLVRLK
jgi:hypothetical protein